MILFLDFDGVLHPLFTLPELSPEESRPFCYLPRFAAVLHDYPHVEVVISSTWGSSATSSSCVSRSRMTCVYG